MFVNGFNLGRYWSVGPQQTLYIPAPLLMTGVNEVTKHRNVAVLTKPRLSKKARKRLFLYHDERHMLLYLRKYWTS